jgi:hypothetical protein
LVDVKENTEMRVGADGVKIWDLQTAKQITVPRQPFDSQVSCVCWVTRRNETVDTLCYGNGVGFLVFLQHRASEVGNHALNPYDINQTIQGRFENLYSARLARGEEIIFITADISGEKTRIATGTRDKCVQVWLFDSTIRELEKVYSMTYGDSKGIVPKVLAFDINDERDFYVFGLYDGGL